MAVAPIEAPAWLWAACAIGAAAAQTARNVMQRTLTQRLGTVGATHVRFLFGLPFGLLFLAAVALASDLCALRPSWSFVAWAAIGGGAQILATTLMLAAMRERSFVLTTAYLKTEPVQVVLFGLVFLGERLGLQAIAAVLLATAGVVLMTVPGPRASGSLGAIDAPGTRAGLRPALMGIAAGALFALSAVGFRGAILELGDASFFARATATLATSLTLQTAVLSAWLAWRQRPVLLEIFRSWRPSLLAGAAGAVASQLWFLAFSLQTAAAVRTVGLVEILFAQLVSYRLFAQATRPREAIGMAAMVAGVGWLLVSAP